MSEANFEFFDLSIAGLGVRVFCSPGSLVPPLAKRYGAFPATQDLFVGAVSYRVMPGVGTPVLAGANVSYLEKGIELTGDGFSGSCDLRAQAATLSVKTDRPGEDLEYFLRVVYAYLAYQAGGILLHAAAVRRGETGLVFFGPSGSGKTTLARLAPDGSVLNDDLVLLLKGTEGWSVYATPFTNPGNVWPANRSAPVAALCGLAHAADAWLERLPPAIALADLYASVPILNDDPVRGPVILDRCQRLSEEIPVYRLHFAPDERLWQLFDRQI